MEGDKLGDGNGFGDMFGFGEGDMGLRDGDEFGVEVGLGI